MEEKREKREKSKVTIWYDWNEIELENGTIINRKDLYSDEWYDQDGWIWRSKDNKKTFEETSETIEF